MKKESFEKSKEEIDLVKEFNELEENLKALEEQPSEDKEKEKKAILSTFFQDMRQKVSGIEMTRLGYNTDTIISPDGRSVVIYVAGDEKGEPMVRYDFQKPEETKHWLKGMAEERSKEIEKLTEEKDKCEEALQKLE